MRDLVFASVAAIAFALVGLTGSSAAAQTTIPGGTLPGASNTWTPAGSPYTIQGDVTIPVGGTLIVQPGVEIRMASTDALGSGVNTSEVELIIQGTLDINGDVANPVVIRGVSTSTGSWRGIRLLSGSTSTIDHTTIRHAERAVDAGTDTTLRDLLLEDNSTGLYLTSGNATIERLRAFDNGIAVRSNSAASFDLDNALITGSSGNAISVSASSTTATSTVNHATVADNSQDGIVFSSSSSSRALNVRNSIIVNNRRGLYRTSSGQLVAFYTNSWGNSSSNSSGASLSTGSFSANPLFVGGTNYRLTETSPARNAGNAEQDIGALPFTGDTFPNLLGTLHSDTVWTLAGSPYILTGDLTVPSGVTLTIEPGVVVAPAASDALGSGVHTGQVELIIEGTLDAQGTAANNIEFRRSSGTWRGIRVLSGAVTTLAHAIIRNADRGIDAGTDTTLRDLLLEDNSTGLYLTSGNATIERLRAFDNGIAVRSNSAASFDLDNALITGSSGNAISVSASSTTATSTVNHATVADNSQDGIVFSSSSSSRALNVRNSIIVNNRRGLYRTSSGQLVAFYTDSWGNSSSNSSGASLSTGSFSANPLFVGGTNYRLTETSPARNAGNAEQDIGALPFTGDAFPNLLGTLHSDTVWTLAGSPYVLTGDLTVPSGVTLTIEPGVVVAPAASDALGSGVHTGQVELIIEGTLDAQGTAANNIEFRRSSGTWRGIRVLSGAITTLAHAIIRNADRGIDAGTDTTLRDLLLEDNSTGLYLTSGNATIERLRAFDNGIAVRSNSAASFDLDNALITGSSGNAISVSANSTTATSTVNHATVADNSQDGIVFSSSSSSRALNVRNSIVVNNRRGLYRTSSGQLVAFYTDSWGNSSSNSSGASLSTGSFSANPLFVGGGDYHLTSTSPCVDTGASTVMTDLEGTVRPLDGNGIGGAQPDVGAYEYVAMAACGNGVLETGEVCDSGPSNGMYGACNATCSGLGPRCGDGATNGPEACDDGNDDNTDGCLNSCVAAACGDGILRAGVEMCDDGNMDDTDACTNSCTMARCGDGSIQVGVETCDDGNTSNTDGCVMCAAATCGDGFVQAGVETCDDANGTNTDACVACQAARCGDGFVHAGVEACDDGNTVGGDGCPASCGAAVCGDGIVDGDEACDDGNRIDGDGCTNACTVARCGDGIVHMGMEACDDGNSSNTDSCVNDCTAASCGDGYVHIGVETCDDGNTNDDDGCTSTCTLRSCGDGVVQSGEACDDGNASNTDECLNTCQRASCGDGHRFVGTEACDDGNSSDSDECLTTCEMAVCGDGYVWDGAEDCDDGNTDNGDGCDDRCMEEEITDPDAGVSDAGTDGGTDAGDMDAGPSPDATADGGEPPSSDGGCGCAIPGQNSRDDKAPVLLGLLLIGLALRRRR